MMVEICRQDGARARPRTSRVEREHIWGIVLAGGEGKRLQPFIQASLGCDRPKQYCAFIQNRSMLRHTLLRAERIIPPEHLLTVVIYPHLPYVREELYDRPSETIIVQPYNLDTAPGILEAIRKVRIELTYGSHGYYLIFDGGLPNDCPNS